MRCQPMKLKQAILYRFTIQLNAILIFYGFFLFFTLVMPVFFVLVLGINDFNAYSDTVIPTMIFLLITALLGQVVEFNFFLQNGVNRRNMFLSNVISISGICILMSILAVILNFIFGNSQIFHYANQIPTIVYHLEMTSFKGTLLTFLITLCLCFFTASIGLLVAALVQKFHRTALTVIGSSVFLVPILISTTFRFLPDGLQKNLIHFVELMIGISPGEQPQPLNLILTLLVISLILLGLYYYLQMHQELKQKDR